VRIRPTLQRLAWLTALGCSACAATKPSALVGVWRSDAARTLASMRATPGIPEDRRRALADGYYGHLTVEYASDTVQARFDNSSYDSGRRPYRVVAATRGYIVTDEWNELLRKFERSTTYVDGDCIYGLAADYGYREYFCRVPP
jgi:hypothetical protein